MSLLLKLNNSNCFHLVYSPGPNSPIKWMQSCVESLTPKDTSPIRKKILLGLNFYGNDYSINGGGPIVGHRFVSFRLKYNLINLILISDTSKFSTNIDQKSYGMNPQRNIISNTSWLKVYF